MKGLSSLEGGPFVVTIYEGIRTKGQGEELERDIVRASRARKE